MKYNRKDLCDNLLSITNLYGYDMLEKLDVDKGINEFELSMFLTTFGAWQILNSSISDYYKMGRDEREVLLGCVTDLEHLSTYWIDSNLFNATKTKLTGSSNSWDFGEYRGIFEFINRVKNKSATNDNIVSDYNLDSEIITTYKILTGFINDRFSTCILLEHLNGVIEKIKTKENSVNSILSHDIELSFKSMYSYVEKRKVYLNTTPEITKEFLSYKEELLNFFYNNHKGRLFDNTVPLLSDKYLKDIVNCAIESEVIDYKEIGDTLKNNIRLYLAEGGKPSTLVSFINNIS